MIVTTSEFYRVAYGRFALDAYNINNMGQCIRDAPNKFDFREPGKTDMAEYAKFIVHKNQKLGSAGHLERVRARFL